MLKHWKIRLLVSVAAFAIAGCTGDPSGDSVATEPQALLVAQAPLPRAEAPDDPTVAPRLARLREIHPHALILPSPDPPTVAPSPAAPGTPNGGWRSLARQAAVTLPQRANGWASLEDSASGVGIRVRLVGAGSAEGRPAGGFMVFPDALAEVDAEHRSAQLLLRSAFEGFEDHVAFDAPPTRPELRYEVEPGVGVAGLRLVDDLLEFLDAQGTPRLRMQRPWAQSGETRVRASVAVEDCLVSTDPAPPWGRAVLPHGARQGEGCIVVVRWEGLPEGPVLVDPEWMTTGSMISRGGLLGVPMGAGRALLTFGGSEVFDATTGVFAVTASSLPSMDDWMVGSLTGGRALVVARVGPAGAQQMSTYDPVRGVWSTPTAVPWSVGPPMGKHLLPVRNGLMAYSGSGGMSGLSFFNDALSTWSRVTVPSTGVTLLGAFPDGRAFGYTGVFIPPPAGGLPRVEVHPVLCDPDTLSCTTDMTSVWPFVTGSAMAPGCPPLVPSGRLRCVPWTGNTIYCVEGYTIVLMGGAPNFAGRIYDPASSAWRAGPDIGQYFGPQLQLENGNILNRLSMGIAAATWMYSSGCGAFPTPRPIFGPLRNAEACDGAGGPCLIQRIGGTIRDQSAVSIPGGWGLLAGGRDESLGLAGTGRSELWTTCDNDNHAETSETCDGTDLRGQSCTDLGFTGGTLRCDSTCGLVVSGCRGLPAPDAGMMDAGRDAGMMDAGAMDSPPADRPSTDLGSADAGVSDAGAPDASPSDMSPTDAPPTDVPPTDVPPTDAPSTDVPPTDAPSTDLGPDVMCTDDPLPAAAPLLAPSFSIPVSEIRLVDPVLNFGVSLKWNLMPNATLASFSNSCQSSLSIGASIEHCTITFGQERCLAVSGQFSNSREYPRVCRAPPRFQCDTSATPCTTTHYGAALSASFPIVPIPPLNYGFLRCTLAATSTLTGNLNVNHQTGPCVCAAGQTAVEPGFSLGFGFSITSCIARIGMTSIDLTPASVSVELCGGGTLQTAFGCMPGARGVADFGFRATVRSSFLSRAVLISPFEWSIGSHYQDGVLSATESAACF